MNFFIMDLRYFASVYRIISILHFNEDINECASNPCKNGGKCKDGVNKYTCTCAAGFTGNTCQTSNYGNIVS